MVGLRTDIGVDGVKRKLYGKIRKILKTTVHVFNGERATTVTNWS